MFLLHKNKIFKVRFRRVFFEGDQPLNMPSHGHQENHQVVKHWVYVLILLGQLYGPNCNQIINVIHLMLQEGH